ncbi:hypothetical protein JQ633_11330 [Bradyrhizobium tropiciagri]|uniref:hypothetical protein n=1 Tax=Bradyrhizobium tropiciagri TaxID=312253 RepID=UPI001BAD22BF|nr:hypothetical protein [Bradyrhizobium tropiciagri]MBR0870952.1 hypothetical protein [Bradyrhizobium tropiciagri]
MKKILLGLLAVVIVAAGLFGVDLYSQRRITGEVEAAFEQVRAQGGKASHGGVSFDVLKRTLTITNVSIETAPFAVKAANVVAHGVSQSDASRFSAESIDVNDIEVSAATDGKQAFKITYKAPLVTLKDYSGPIGQFRRPASSSLIDLYRFGFEQLAAISATSISVPGMTGTVQATTPRGDVTAGEFTYSGLVLDNIKDGKIASTKAGNALFTADTQAAGKAVKITGKLTDIVASDIDFGAMAAAFDPAKADGDKVYLMYRHIAAGPYEVSSTQGLNMRIDGMTIDDVGITPSRMQLPKLLEMIPPAGATPPTPEEARAMMERVAAIYDGIRIGSSEMRGLSIETPQGPLKLASIRLNLANGKIGEFAVEGFDGRGPQGPIKLGRFALKAVDIANLMRLTAQFAAQKPLPEQALALLPLIEGAELKGLVAPYKATGKPVNIDLLSLDWGQFVGSVPSKLRLTAKMSGPLDTADPAQQQLIAAGIDNMTIDADLGAAWTEASRAFALEPVKLDLGGLVNASARASLGNVPREVFAMNPQSIAAASQIEAGAIELTLHDLGVVDLAVGAFSRTHGGGKDEARQAILAGIKAQGEAIGGSNPEAAALLAAISRFVETPGQTLVIKLTPRAKAPAQQLLELLKTDPQSALAQFRIEASTGL